MTEQQACTLCGAGGHTAAQCNWNKADGAQGERVAFEAHYFRHPLLRDELSGAYFDRELGTLWDAWQARAALAQPYPKPEPRLVECDACPTSGGCVETCMKAPAQPSPAPELERPDVVGTVVAGPGGTFDAQLKYGPVNGGRVNVGDELVLVHEHDRIVGALRSDRDSWEQQASDRVADWDAMRQERDADQARVAELEAHCVRLGQGGAERYWENRWREADARLHELEKQEPVAEVFTILDADGTRAEVKVLKPRLCLNMKLYAAPVAQAGQVPDALREAVQYLDANFLNQISSGSVLHRKLSEALAAAPAQGGE